MPSREHELRDIIGQIAGCDAAALGLDDDVMDVLGVDSLAALRLLAAVEKRFSVRFPDERLSEFRTMRRILDGLKTT